VRRAAPHVALACALLTGCLTKPPVEESWTKLEIVDVQSSPPSGEDSTGTINVRARITYRAIVTASIIADVRYTTDPALVTDLATNPLDSVEPQLESAQRVDVLSQNSTSLVFADQLVTGFDHLIQEVDLAIAGDPFTADSTVTPDSTGALLVVLSMAAVDEVELEDGEEMLVVTPYLTTDLDVLSAALPLEREE
jgi:hypothetical protein